MTTIGQLEITARGDREIVMTRKFNAPRRLVWDAWTKPELIKRWLGALDGWTFDVCEVDLRVGGTYRFVWRGPDGNKMGMGGMYQEIAAPERLVSTEAFDEAWYPGDALNTIVLTEEGGRTTCQQTTRYQSTEARDGVLNSDATDGVAFSYDKLEELLASL